MTKWAATALSTAHSARVSSGTTRSRVVAGQRPVAVPLAGGHLDGEDEAADEPRGHVLEGGAVGPRRRRMPWARHRVASTRSSAAPSASRPRSAAYEAGGHGEHAVDVGAVAQATDVEPAGGDGVLDVVHRVGDVVGPVHDVGLEAPRPAGRSPRGTTRRPAGRRRRRRTSACRPGRAPRRHGYLVAASRLARVRLSPAGRPSGWTRLGSRRVSSAQRLGVALEAADVGGDGVEGAARRCARTAGGRGRGPGRRCRRRRRCSRAPRRTRGRSGRPRGEWVSRLRTKSSSPGWTTWVLADEPAQRRGVDQPGPVAGEVVAVGALVGGVLRAPSARGRPRCRSRGRALRPGTGSPVAGGLRGPAARSTHLGSVP